MYDLSASLLILEVEPFLILAVGVDNIFIFVQSYQVNFFLRFRVSVTVKMKIHYNTL